MCPYLRDSTLINFFFFVLVIPFFQSHGLHSPYYLLEHDLFFSSQFFLACDA
jgi:hypothetical protein